MENNKFSYEKRLLHLLSEDSRLTAEKLAVMLDKDEGDIKAMIEKYEQDGVIIGYRTVIDWDKTDYEYVSALIELKITPQRGYGFDSVAERICKYDEVKSVLLMSGGFDLALFIEGKTMREVAYFVADKLAPLEYVTATATHFVLHRYKEDGMMYRPAQKDERGNII
ncbi:MAG: AsnC family transcriptional regulator [Clostridiales bacterium GWF2_38_85]|nr:MAG: AsnC family transcriptional regulator [Clostridiales bacterium GWF2_38_85]HBL84254.1 AsnC family transcriptional regulator [Clostridiales bacterium]